MTRLTEDQKAKAIELFEQDLDLKDITQQVFADYSLDGRSKEGRTVRAFLAAQGKDYNTSKSEAKISFNLTESQKDMLLSDLIDKDMKPLEIAKMIFDDPKIKSLSSQHRVTIDFLKRCRPEILDDDDFYAEGTWFPPKSEKTVLRKINRWCHVGIGEDIATLSSRHRKYVERLLNYMQSYKLGITLNSFSVSTDRELFESEFVRATWDKPDLTTDELNLYMMVCSCMVRAKHIQKRLDNLAIRLDNMGVADGDDEPTMRLTEHIKQTADELNATEKRIETLVGKLNGERKNRLDETSKTHASFLYFVEEFQQEGSRNRLVQMAEMQNKLIGDEADRLESMNEMKARVFGISKQELT